MSPTQVACALMVPLLWELQFVVIKIGLTKFPPLFFLALRFLAIAALLLPFVGRPARREIGPIIGISIFMGGLNFALTFLGLAHGPASILSVVNQLSSPFMVLLAWPMLGERPSLRVSLGVALAFGGVAIMVIHPSTTVTLVPVLLMVGSGLALAVGSVLVKRYGPFEPFKLLAWMSLLTVPQVFVASAVLEHGQFASLQTATPAAWLALAYTVLLGGILGFGLWFRLIAGSSMSKVAPFTLLQTVFAVAAGVFFLHEPLTLPLIAGMLVCIGGVAITQSGSARRRSDPPPRSTPHTPSSNPLRDNQRDGDTRSHRDRKAMRMSGTLEGFRDQMVRAGDIGMHAVVGGQGSPLVLIHGFPQTWWEWRRMMPRLAETHTVVAVDLRGAGHSDCPQGGYDKVTMAADVHAVMQALGHERYAVCGHDIGGMVALALACTHRSSVTRPAILDVSQPGWSGWEANCAKPAMWHFAFHQKRDLPERLLFGREYDYVSTFIADRAFDQGAHTIEDVQVFARSLAQPGNTRGGLEWYRAFPTDHRTALAWRQDKLAMPVLALGGEHNYGPGMVAMLEEFASDVSGGSIAGCAHWLPEERPTETADALIEFLT